MGRDAGSKTTKNNIGTRGSSVARQTPQMGKARGKENERLKEQVCIKVHEAGEGLLSRRMGRHHGKTSFPSLMPTSSTASVEMEDMGPWAHRCGDHSGGTI